MILFESAADRLTIEYQGFLDYLASNEVKLSKSTEHIGKKDCYALNHQFNIINERYQKIGRTQDYYAVIDFFYFFSIRSGILRFIKKKSLGLTIQRSQRYELFSEMSAMEQYIMMMAVWLGEYQGAMNGPYSVFGGNDLFERMKEGKGKNVLPDVFNRTRDDFWGRYYIPEIRLFALFKLISIEWLNENQEDKENKFRIKKLYQTQEGCLIKTLLSKHEIDFWCSPDITMVLSAVKNIVGEDSNNIEEKLIQFWTHPLEKEIQTIELRIVVGSCIRNIKVGNQFTLDDLHYLIQKSVEFDMDHLYYFQIGSGTLVRKYFAPMCVDETWQTDSVILAELLLYEGMKFEYVFDFGDEWNFQITVENILDEHTKECEIYIVKGEAPEQYRY